MLFWGAVRWLPETKAFDEAFGRVSSRAEPVESFHHSVNSKVQDIFFALYRDFPDANRVAGQEKF